LSRAMLTHIWYVKSREHLLKGKAHYSLTLH
jgi:hypothetical protein